MTNPIPKTFYSHRIFVVYHANDYRNYLLRIVDKRGWPEKDKDRFPLTLGLMAWGTILAYRARMVAIDFNRRLKTLVNDKGEFFEQNYSVPLSRTLYRRELTMQLGIEAIVRESGVKERMTERPVLSQFVYDTLYMPSFYHEMRSKSGAEQERAKPVTDKKDFINITQEELRKHLWFRSQGDASRKVTEGFAEEHLEYLFGILKRYIDLLATPKLIREKTLQFAAEQDHDSDKRLWRNLANTLVSYPLVSFPEP